jgi:predicted RNA-binding protein with PUA-like domain
MRYWLFKSEPKSFSLNDLMAAKEQTTHWDGVRNYQARNMLRDEINIGDQAFFYHSNCTPPGIAGIVTITKAGYPDVTAWDKQDAHFDPKTNKEHPTWFMVDVRFQKKFPQFISLDMLKSHPQLSSLKILQKGNRLSITPLTEHEWTTILKIAD